MKKIVVSLLVASITLSSCSLFAKDPQKTVNNGMSAFADVKKMSSKLVISGTINAPAGEVPAKVQFSLDATGTADTTNDEDPKLDMTLSINGSADDKNISGEVGIKTVDKKVYVSLIKLDIPGNGGGALQTQIAPLLNTWWALPTGDQGPFGNLSKEQKDLQEKFRTIKFFTGAEEQAQENVQEVETTRYRVDVDKEAVKGFILDIANASDNQLSPEEEKAIGDGLKDVEFSGAVWVGNDDDTIHRIQGTLTVQPAQGPVSSYELDYSAWNFGGDVTVTAPEAAQDFNPLMILPLFGALSSLSAESAPATDAPPTPAVPGAAQ